MNLKTQNEILFIIVITSYITYFFHSLVTMPVVSKATPGLAAVIAILFAGSFRGARVFPLFTARAAISGVYVKAFVHFNPSCSIICIVVSVSNAGGKNN